MSERSEIILSIQKFFAMMAVLGLFQAWIFLYKGYFNPSTEFIDITQTWSITPPVDTGSVVNTWSSTRQDYNNALSGTWLETIESKVNYALSFGEKWNDFITVVPQQQNISLWATKSSNNILIQSFIQKNQYWFKINKNRTGYLVINTQKRVPDSKDMILWINGKSMGSFHKNIESNKFKSDVSDNYLDTLYIFPLDNIKIAQIQTPLNLNTFDPLNLTIVIGENSNSVQSLSIVYID